MRFDDVDLARLAEHVPTPFYVYSASLLRERVAALQQALQGSDHLICFAAKANSNRAVLALLGELGIGADIVSAGEMQRCLQAGIPAVRLVFSGVGKSAQEIDAALQAGVWKFNLESYEELLLLQDIASRRGCRAQAAVRINPDVDAQTHAKISTGKAENKFGVSLAQARYCFEQAAGFSHVRLDGLHVHIGSQILSLQPFRQALQRVLAFWRELRDAGHAIASIDVGGGLFLAATAQDYIALVRDQLREFDGRLVFEPGRWLVAEAGLLISRVIRTKRGDSREFLVLDAAMNDLLRPALYGAWHDIVVLQGEDRPGAVYDVVGPVCESSDTFAVARELPRCEAGDLVAFTSAGAYGASMGSTYNSRPLIAEVLLDRGRYAIVRRAQTVQEMTAGEQLPEWQDS